MEKIYIYGAGNTGAHAYDWLSQNYEVVGFIDSDPDKHGKLLKNVPVYSPDVLYENRSVNKLYIASIYHKEILENLYAMNLQKHIYIYTVTTYPVIHPNMLEGLESRTIDLGDFLLRCSPIFCKEITYVTGSSRILDYAFLVAVAKFFNCKTYLEIGTYIGESINILTDYCDRLINVTAKPGSKYSMRDWCKRLDVPDYSERLTYSSKIEHNYTDSKLFDFKSVGNSVDLYFIDGDHSYEGVKADTLNVFKHRKENSIVIWHDAKLSFTEYNYDVIAGIHDALGEAEFKNFFVVNNNICGIYIPEEYRGIFKLKALKYGVGELYVYDTEIKVKNMID